MSGRLEGKKIVVTAAGQGIGKAPQLHFKTKVQMLLQQI